MSRPVALEIHLARNLNNSWTAWQSSRAYCRQCTETICYYRTRVDKLTGCWVELCGRIHRCPIRVVKGVVRFQSKLDVALRVFSVLELLKQRDVPVVES